MSRRKRYPRGNVYIINDELLVKHNKPGRRIVAVNNDRENLHVRRITKVANGGRNARNGYRIEKYPDIPQYSVVENKTFKKTKTGKPIKEYKLFKTKTRLNKWDMKKITGK